MTTVVHPGDSLRPTAPPCSCSEHSPCSGHSRSGSGRVGRRPPLIPASVIGSQLLTFLDSKGIFSFLAAYAHVA